MFFLHHLVSLVESFFRLGDNESMFKDFCLTNPHDVQACWKFFSHVIKIFLGRVNNENFSDDDGSCMMLVALCSILHKDFDSWWKHSRKKENIAEAINNPIIYFLLGGSSVEVIVNLKSSVLKLYKWSVKSVNAELMSMCGAVRYRDRNGIFWKL